MNVCSKIDENYLFPIPVMVMTWKAEPGFNERISEKVIESTIKHMGEDERYFTKVNFFSEVSGQDGAELRRMFTFGMKKFIDKMFPKDTFEKSDLYMRAWPRYYKTSRRSILPHYHNNANVVCTYYSNVPNARTSKFQDYSPGSTVMVDTRSMANYGWEQPQLSCVPIDPQTGTMIIMPAWLMHYVEPINDDQSNRAVVISNGVLQAKEFKYEKVDFGNM